MKSAYFKEKSFARTWKYLADLTYFNSKYVSVVQENYSNLCTSSVSIFKKHFEYDLQSLKMHLEMAIIDKFQLNLKNIDEDIRYFQPASKHCESLQKYRDFYDKSPVIKVLYFILYCSI